MDCLKEEELQELFINFKKELGDFNYGFPKSTWTNNRTKWLH